MMYYDKVGERLINLSLANCIFSESKTHRVFGTNEYKVEWSLYAVYTDHTGIVNTPTIASFETKEEAIAELKYIAKEMNK